MTAIDRLRGLSDDVAIKYPCRVATTANITLNGLQTIDGVVLASGDRVLVKNQTSGVDNGIYAANTSDWARDVDFSGPGDLAQGTLVLVVSGTASGSTVFQLTTASPVIGTTALTFAVTGAAALALASAFWLAIFPLATAALSRAALGAVNIAGDTLTGALNEKHGADIASASTINLTTATGNVVDVTGTTTITAVTLAEGAERVVRFTGALILTHGSSLILPTAANITTVAGDFAVFRGYAAGVVRCTDYQRADGTPLALAATTVPFSGSRQTVASGPVTSVGLADFLPSTDADLNLGSQNISSSYPFAATAANGWSATTGLATDRVGYNTSSLTWSALTINRAAATPNFLYVLVNADGTLTTGSTIVAPVYQWGGTPATTSGLFTFNISEMKGYLGNGTTAPQAYIVLVGEAATDGTGVISTVAYAYNGRYESAYTATLPAAATAVAVNHNIGVIPRITDWRIQCTTSNAGYAVGDELSRCDVNNDNGAQFMNLILAASKLAMSVISSVTNPYWVCAKATGLRTALTVASWQYKFIAQRGW